MVQKNTIKILYFHTTETVPDTQVNKRADKHYYHKRLQFGVKTKRTLTSLSRLRMKREVWREIQTASLDQTSLRQKSSCFLYI